uniref:Probable ATP-dependent transporter ycf16 n=1 Tax=Pyropia perforata TaxID=182771 RepID=A0A023HQQ6_PYRPE|nr:iron-sulfur cluster formation ABC transporter ATP-binding subunit [Neoporphyra perforata]AGQ17067.1 iron-sulfur cluster formation ABC transporter ATP-binding subunit [Neoporphyra perforata]AHB35019.1 iron-sulfur cluster formation ABC transporter ATP-binding subunit [Neoporphyra perforata]AHB35228.1 iron-sulfur cluster formation ABC transporter ATP-binding subunit [Neoporphyra perforata]AIA19390.1 iron-sulfur cluster formation ABC transporter ATP-binding subunit [Neoporphyra perforata]AIA195
MSHTILEVKDLYASVGEITILKGVNLSVQAGEIHAIMGPNGSGKSTLSKVIAGHPAYSLISGDILFFGKSVLEMEPDERARAGIFLAFQYPVEIPGVSNADFLRIALNSRRKFRGLSELSPLEFFQLITEKINLVGMEESFLTRNVNEGFSGGEKKRNEILQMALLDSSLSILDETDSGLDIDALRVVANGINTLAKPTNSIILITHYQRLLDYIIPDFVHIMSNGKIVKTGDFSLAQDLEKYGYDRIK